MAHAPHVGLQTTFPHHGEGLAPSNACGLERRAREAELCTGKAATRTGRKELQHVSQRQRGGNSLYRPPRRPARQTYAGLQDQATPWLARLQAEPSLEKRRGATAPRGAAAPKEAKGGTESAAKPKERDPLPLHVPFHQTPVQRAEMAGTAACCVKGLFPPPHSKHRNWEEAPPEGVQVDVSHAV